MKRKKKKKLSQIVSEGWTKLEVKLVVIGTLFISFILVIILIFMDVQSDAKILESKANKYETYIDQLLLARFTQDELKAMGGDELKMAIDMVVEEESNRLSSAPALNDFILPVKEDDYSTRFQQTREPKKNWSKEELEHFWIDLNDLDIKNLDENNFDYLKARLKEVR